MPENGQRNLYQKLATIAQEVGRIKVTGKTQHGTPAMSIQDVEEALGDLFAQHGVVTGYTWNTSPVMIEQSTAGKINLKTGEVGPEGKMILWVADITVWIRDANDAPKMTIQPQGEVRLIEGLCIRDRTCDIGSTPSAAVSFALKRYYRALFHLADEEEETRTVRMENVTFHGKGSRTMSEAGAVQGGSPQPQPPTGPLGAPVGVHHSTIKGAGESPVAAPDLPDRQTLLLKITTLGATRYGKAWRESVQLLARKVVTRPFNLVQDLSIEELEKVAAELESIPEAVKP